MHQPGMEKSAGVHTSFWVSLPEKRQIPATGGQHCFQVLLTSSVYITIIQKASAMTMKKALQQRRIITMKLSSNTLIANKKVQDLCLQTNCSYS
jgi:hypothetical protein